MLAAALVFVIAYAAPTGGNAPVPTTTTSTRTLLITWGALLGTLFFARNRVLNVTSGTLDDYVSVATLVILMIVVWGYALYDLKLSNQKREDRGDSQWRIASRHFKKSKVALTGLVILVLMYVIALLAPLLAPYDPAERAGRPARCPTTRCS